MTFASTSFLFLFLPVVLVLCQLYKGINYQNLILLVASGLFYYLGEGSYSVILLFSILANYLLGIILERLNKSQKKLFLSFGIICNLALIGYWKYSDFLFHWGTIHLPIGISFFTFHCISYLVDVYRGHFKAEQRLDRLALYIVFFPQLIAGPIVRYKDIAQQFIERRSDLKTFLGGVDRILIGVAKKVLIANTLGSVADQIYELPRHEVSTALAWIGSITYTLQIYFDFSGYSDMAVGCAALFGFRFPENFNYPYIARSITDFWRRWHISLSTWFRDYLYIPLGGNRGSPIRTYFNLATVFFLCGLWHGAAWTFVAWGIFHGIFLILERSKYGQFLHRSPRWCQHVYALVVVMMGWVFFRAGSIKIAFWHLGAMWGLTPQPTTDFPIGKLITLDVRWAFCIALIAMTPVLPQVRDRLQRWIGAESTLLIGRTALYILFVFATAELAAGTFNPFLYFRF
jgi:alginate O-acetyltransferase complex protein AlgI